MKKTLAVALVIFTAITDSVSATDYFEEYDIWSLKVLSTREGTIKHVATLDGATARRLEQP